MDLSSVMRGAAATLLFFVLPSMAWPALAESDWNAGADLSQAPAAELSDLIHELERHRIYRSAEDLEILLARAEARIRLGYRSIRGDLIQSGVREARLGVFVSGSLGLPVFNVRAQRLVALGQILMGRQDRDLEAVDRALRLLANLQVPDELPDEDWLKLQNLHGSGLLVRGLLLDDRQPIEEAIQLYRTSLEDARAQGEGLWALNLRINLAEALVESAGIDNAAAPFEERPEIVSASLEEALAIFSGLVARSAPQQFPEQWARVRVVYAQGLTLRGWQRKNAENLLHAIKLFGDVAAHWRATGAIGLAKAAEAAKETSQQLLNRIYVEG